MQRYHIILAGAGPGDPDLVTIKLVTALKTAEIIIVDRLVNPEILHRYASANAVVIPVGKQGYNKDSSLQEDINQLIITSVKTGKKVLRLKGGDVAIYSNVIDEINTLKQHEISFEIIPGITAASGAAASMNIPLTARDIAPGMQIHTLSSGKTISEANLQVWAETQDTLVFYMSIAPLEQLVKGLLLFHADPLLPIAIIEEATTPAQAVYLYTLESVLPESRNRNFRTPALVIVGKILNSVDLASFHSYDGTLSAFDSLIPPFVNTKLHVI